MSVQFTFKTLKMAMRVVKGDIEFTHLVWAIEKQGIRKSLASAIARAAVAKVA